MLDAILFLLQHQIMQTPHNTPDIERLMLGSFDGNNNDARHDIAHLLKIHNQQCTEIRLY